MIHSREGGMKINDMNVLQKARDIINDALDALIASIEGSEPDAAEDDGELSLT